jgi:secondary thiamine-phosphate synthase enzyme
MPEWSSNVKSSHHGICVRTGGCYEFTDITPNVLGLVLDSGVSNGMVNVQTMHTTTAIVINENEPGLLEDMARLLERIAPRDGYFQHNECPPELPGVPHDNGHSHCKAMLLKTSETLNIVDGRVQLGQWQRIFLLELDRGRDRQVSVMVLGDEAPERRLSLAYGQGSLHSK